MLKGFTEEVLGDAFPIVHGAYEKGILLRLLGGIAIRVHCPQAWGAYSEIRGPAADVDCACRGEQVAAVSRLFQELGFEENQAVRYQFGTQRRIFWQPGGVLHCDVFVDRLRFCHEIDIRGRLALDSPTLPVADLVLSKLQIVNLDRKDLIDTIMLLRDHDLGADGAEAIDATYIARLCGRDWGLWRTVTKNLARVCHQACELVREEADSALVAGRASALRDYIAAEPKSLTWRCRGALGERVKWYKDVEEVART